MAHLTQGRPFPRWPVLLVLFGLVVALPIACWASVVVRDWGNGGSPAAELDGPYFWGVLLARLIGGFVLAALLWLVRGPASVWITVTSVWLAGPAFQLLLNGVTILAASAGQRSLPENPLAVAMLWSLGPAVVTICLLGFKSSRAAYGMGRNRQRHE